MGTYDGAGTRISDDTPIRFLYNGQFGVETDENGLYYMRARYYNTDIKRFMNRDIINGSIENSQSLNKYCYVQGSGTVTAHTSSSIKNTGSPEVSDNKARVQAQVGGENGLSRRAVAEKKLAEAARGTRAEGVLISKDGDVPVHQSQQQLVNSIESVGARYIGNTRNGDGQIYHMDTPDGSVEIRIMQQKPGQTNPYLDNRTVIVEQGSVGQGTGIYTYGNGARITGAVPKNMRKAIGHTHGQIP